MTGLIFTYVLCFGGAVVSLFRPFVGLLVYIAFAILKPPSLWWWSVPDWNYSRVVAIALVLGWAAHGFGRWEIGRARGIVLAFLALWVWSIASTLQAADQEKAWSFVDNILKILIPFIVGITIIDSVRKIQQVLWVMVLCQSYLALHFNLFYFNGYNLLKEGGFAGMEEGSVAVGMVSVLGLALYLTVEADTWWQKAIAFFCAGQLVHAVLISFNRGSMIGVITVGIVGALIIPNSLKKNLILGIGAVCGLWLAGPEVLRRFNTAFADASARDPSAQSRLILWGNCWDAMLRRPVFGLGPCNFPLAAKDVYGWGYLKEGHSLWLQMGAELGIPGLVFLLLFYGLGLLSLMPLARQKVEVPHPWVRHTARMVVISTVGFAVAAQFISLWAIEPPYYTMLIGACAIKLYDEWAKNAGEENPAIQDSLNSAGFEPEPDM